MSISRIPYVTVTLHRHQTRPGCSRILVSLWSPASHLPPLGYPPRERLVEREWCREYARELANDYAKEFGLTYDGAGQKMLDGSYRYQLTAASLSL
jgi:hypothetical protein